MSINRINVNGSSLLFSERKIFPLENGVWRGMGWVDKAPSAPRLRRSLLPPSYILAQTSDVILFSFIFLRVIFRLIGRI